ncbi:S41 family peptidase [Mucilaginibacter antarcticus]|uniref:S41 family peptidase n=2 Tax=Mucilaginibacter antarcticus TaxID=1855725 RepID=A0ABW5XUM0_9SPHI
MRKAFYFVLLIAASGFISCKKDKKYNGAEPSKDGSAFDLIKDSVYLYAQETYYWHDGLPGYAAFNPRIVTGSTDLAALSAEVNKLSQYKIDPATGYPFEYYAPAAGVAKYSYIDGGESSTSLNGTNSNFGFAPFYNTANDLRIKYVYPGSPADLAGVKRGYKIVSINGNADIGYDGASGTHTQFVINAYARNSSIAMVLQKPDNTNLTVNLTSADYAVNPVLNYKTVDAGGGKIVGYIVFNSFTSPANANAKLDAAFNYFQSQGVTNLVVDLRYNGGGYTATAEYLDNLIVPSGKTGTAMYSYYFNDILQAGKAKLLANQVRRDSQTGELYNLAQFNYTVATNTVKFAKKGALNLNRVFFIVTGATASASELAINSLRPHMDVQLIGNNTYGKPVGFFDIKINKYSLYVAQFETKNSAGQGGYYTGMLPGSANYPGIADYDDATKDFGDTTEVLFHHAINYIKRGTYSTPIVKTQSLSGGQKTFSLKQSNDAAIELEAGKFNGMIYKQR